MNAFSLCLNYDAHFVSEQTVLQKQLYFIAKKYILLQFYIEILNTLLLSSISQANAYAVRVIVVLCLLLARTVLPNDDKYKCSYLISSLISLMMDQKLTKHVEYYNSI